MVNIEFTVMTERNMVEKSDPDNAADILVQQISVGSKLRPQFEQLCRANGTLQKKGLTIKVRTDLGVWHPQRTERGSAGYELAGYSIEITEGRKTTKLYYNGNGVVGLNGKILDPTCPEVATAEQLLALATEMQSTLTLDPELEQPITSTHQATTNLLRPREMPVDYQHHY